jgi:uncharacterized protein (DUF885 family)
MNRLLKIVAGLLAALLVAVAVFAVPTLWGKPWSYEHFTLRMLIVEFLHSPQLSTQLGISIPFSGGDSELDDLSPAAFEAAMQRFDESIEMQASYARPDDEIGALSWDVFGLFLKNLRATEGFGSYTITQLDGPHVSLPDFLVQYHAVEDADSAESYLARLSKVPRALEQAMEFANWRAEKGWIAPTFILDKIVKDARGFTDKPPAESPVVAELGKKLAEANVAGADGYVQRATELVEQKVYPAFQRFARDMDALKARSRPEPGLWKLEGGAQLYRANLRHMTTTDLSPDEIHALGNKTLADLEAQTRPLLDELGVEYTSVGEGLRKLAADPRFSFPASKEGEEQALAYSRELVAKIDEASKAHFGVRPTTGVEVERVPAFKEESAPGAYYSSPALDGSRGGLFFLNLRDVGKLGKHSLPTLVCHEAIPGHHFQIAIAQTLDELPFFRRLIPFNAFGEGWALYSERLCDQIGFFDTPQARLGFLDAQMFRATRLVVDTGLHHGKWSREQAVTFMTEHTGMGASDIEAEVDRYTMWPGQACGYMVGQLKLLEIRARAEEKLGDAFDAKAFHDRILTFGSLPLGLLEREMDAWIAAQRE